MIYAILLSGIFICCFFIVRGSAMKYSTLAVIGFFGVEREKLVKLRLSQKIKSEGQGLLWKKVIEKLDREIHIFNKMNIVMPCRHGVAVMYIDTMACLFENPRWICNCEEGYEKLFYLFAAVNLFGLTSEELARKQLLKNCLYVFGAKTSIKKNSSKLCNCFPKLHTNFFAVKQPAFKFLHGQTLAKFVNSTLPFEIRNNSSDAPVCLGSRYSTSYAVYCGERVEVKHFVDRILPVECFVVSVSENNGGFRFTWKTGEDKMQFDLSHTTDTFYYVNVKTKRAVGIFVRGRNVCFGSTFAQSEKELDINVNLSGDNNAQIFVVHGNSKSEVLTCVSKIKQQKGKLNYLVDSRKRAIISEIEELYRRAYFSRFVTGEDLRERYTSALKLVPTLHMPTLVYCIETASDFFEVVDRFDLYKKMASGCKNFNVVLLYSSQNDNVREIINAYINRTEVRELLDRGIFLFFINKVTAAEGALYYLSKMAVYKARVSNCKGKVNNLVEITEHVSNTYPITHSVFARNTAKQSVSTSVKTQLLFNAPLNIARRTNTLLSVVSLNNGRTSDYKIPLGSRIFDDNGAEIKDNYHVTSNAVLRLDVRLSAFEERRFDIIRNDGVLSAKDRKNAFVGSLQNIRIDAADKRLTALFSLPIEPSVPCPASLAVSLKTAIKTADQNLMYALFGKRDSLPAEIYKLLIERVIGVKLVRSQIQLLPKIELTGSFTLSFIYQDKPFEFVVKKAASGFNVRYGDQESYNYLQVGV